PRAAPPALAGAHERGSGYNPTARPRQESPMDLEGTRVIVTGASTGIGRVTALHLALRGPRALPAARDERRLDALAAEHPEIVSAPCDVADDADRASLVKQCEPVDVLVNNAGVGWQGTVEAMPPDKVRQLL